MLKPLLLKILLFFPLQLIQPPASQANERCIDLFSIPPAPNYRITQGEIRYYKTDEIFAVQDVKNNFEFHATVSPRGVLDIMAFLVSPDTNERSQLRGRELYDQAIEHFGHKRIKKIAGTWLDDTNYTQFFRYVSEGHTYKEAAGMTWSGRQAARNGFSIVESVNLLPNPWGATTVKVLFVRPSE